MSAAELACPIMCGGAGHGDKKLKDPHVEDKEVWRVERHAITRPLARVSPAHNLRV